MYNVLVKPFENPSLNRLEVFNETCIIAAAYHLFAYTDFLPSPDMQYKVGWSMIAITVFNIGVNMLVMLVGTVASIKKSFRYWSRRLKRWRSVKQAKKYA